MHDIFALTDECGRWGPAVVYAAAVAALVQGTLTATCRLPPPPPERDFIPASLAAEVVELCREQTDTALRAGAALRSWAARRGVPVSSWRVADGAAIDILESAADWHDLLVIERGIMLTREETGRILLGVDVPLVLVPPHHDAARFDTIAVAWNGSLSAVRALHASLPLLRRAQKVLLIDGAPEGVSYEDPCMDVPAYLQMRGIQMQRLRIKPDAAHAGEELLAAADAARADLLVMGAYGRSRASEWAFGGATRYMLDHAHLPVLMRH